MKTQYPENFKVLGQNLAYYRKRAGYTQEAFAEYIGKSANFISQIEGPATLKGVSLETLFKMADTLHIPPGQLLDGR